MSAPSQLGNLRKREIGSRSRRSLSLVYAGTLPPHMGGSALSCWQILSGLARRGHRIRAVSGMTRQALEGGGELWQFPELEATRFVVPDGRPSSPVATQDPYRQIERSESRRLVAELVAAERPDLILIGRESFAWELPELAERCSLPCVALVRGGTTLEMLARGAEPAARLLLEQYKKVDLIVTPALHLAERLAGLGLGPLAVVPNAIDLDAFRPEPKDPSLMRHLRIASTDIVVAHLSTLGAQKRPLDLVRSAAQALRLLPDLLYLVVGTGLHREEVEKLAGELGISGRFRFVGWVPYAEVPRYVNLADVVAMTSEAEGMARVYLEAQACARTLVASDIAAAREVVVSGETGLLFRVGDVEDLTARTLEAARDPDLRARIGREARCAVENRSLDEAVGSYEELLLRAVAGHRSRRS